MEKGKIITNGNTIPETMDKLNQVTNLKTNPDLNSPRSPMGFNQKVDQPPFPIYTGCVAKYKDSYPDFVFKGIDPDSEQPLFFGEWEGTTHKITSKDSWANFKLVLRPIESITFEEFKTVIEIIAPVKHPDREVFENFLVQLKQQGLQAFYLVATPWETPAPNFCLVQLHIFLIKNRFDLGLIPQEYFVLESPRL